MDVSVEPAVLRQKGGDGDEEKMLALFLYL